MSVEITITNVPEEVHDELAARVAVPGKSMQEFLRYELERIAARPSAEEWLARVRELRIAEPARVPAEVIL